MTTDQLQMQTPHSLRLLFEEQYYRITCGNRTLLTNEQVLAKCKVLYRSIRTIEKACAKLDLFDLAIVCRDTNKELVEQADLIIEEPH